MVSETSQNQEKKTEFVKISGVAMRYADAIYDLAQNEKKIEEVEGNMKNLEQVIEESQELKRFIQAPIFSIEQKHNALDEIMKKIKVEKLFNRFIHVVIDNRRCDSIGEIIKAFKDKLSKMRGETIANIVTAHELNKEQITKLKNTIKDVIGKEVDMHISTDETLQGGMIVKIGSKQIDTSIKTKLSSLRLTLKEVG